MARHLGGGLKLPSEEPRKLTERANFYAEVLSFAAVRTLSPAVGKLSGDDDQLREVLRWTETKRQEDKDIEHYRERYLIQSGSSSVLEELKKVFPNEHDDTSCTCEMYTLLDQEDEMANSLRHLTLAPSQGDRDIDRYAFETMLTTLFNEQHIILADLGNTSLENRTWRGRCKGQFY